MSRLSGTAGSSRARSTSSCGLRMYGGIAPSSPSSPSSPPPLVAWCTPNSAAAHCPAGRASRVISTLSVRTPRSGLLGQGREPVKRGAEAVCRGRPGPRQPALVGQPGPVVGVGYPGARRAGWPSSQRHRCPGGSRPGSAGVQAIRRPSSNSTTWFSRMAPLVSIVVNTSPACRTRCPAARCGQVVVAVPARLGRRIRDQREDPLRPGRDLPAGADHPRRLLLSCHALGQGCS